MKPFKLMLNYFWGTVTELLSLFVILILYPFRTSKLDSSSKTGPNILCVHGYLHNGSAWGYYRYKLQAAGAGPVNQLTYPSLTRDIPENSLRVKAKIEQIKLETGHDVPILIGHSQGGLESLEYALEYAPKDKPIYVVTLGSPLHGTKVAHIGLGPSSRQMHEGSSYIKSLQERLSKATHIRLLALYSNVDFIIRPVDSAKASELNYATIQEIPGLGHMGFLFSPRALDKIIAFLKESQALPEKMD